MHEMIGALSIYDISHHIFKGEYKAMFRLNETTQTLQFYRYQIRYRYSLLLQGVLIYVKFTERVGSYLRNISMRSYSIT